MVDALLARIERMNPALHAFIDVYASDARLAAEAADRAIRSGHAVGPLHRVPVALKDLVDLEVRVTTGGSKVWEKCASTVTATLAPTFIQAGMIVLGKTHTVEFAFAAEVLGQGWWTVAEALSPDGRRALAERQFTTPGSKYRGGIWPISRSGHSGGLGFRSRCWDTARWSCGESRAVAGSAP